MVPFDITLDGKHHGELFDFLVQSKPPPSVNGARRSPTPVRHPWGSRAETGAVGMVGPNAA